MFKFLKDKLKNALGAFSKKVQKEAVEEAPEKEEKKEKIPKEKPKEEKPEKKREEIKEKKEESKQEKTEEIEKDVKKKGRTKEEKKEKIKKKEEPKEKKKAKEKEEPEKIKVPEEEKEKKGFFQKIFGKKGEEQKEEIEKKEEESEEAKEKVKEEPKKIEEVEVKKIEKEEAEEKQKKFEEEKKEKEPEIKEKPEGELAEKKEIKPEKRGFFQKVGDAFTKISLSEKKFDEIFWDLEVVLLENNVALEVIEKIREDLKKELTSEKIPRGSVDKLVTTSLKNSIEELFDVEKIDLIDKIKKKKPYVIVFVGVNGSGKTTNLVKFADICLKNNLKPVIAACDTFRAAAIQQLEQHASKLNVKLIKHDYGADAAAVAYDAIGHARAKGFDVVLIDTAGRSHANANLMDELKKVIRIANPDFTVFVGDSLTGNDAVEQAKTFNEAVGVDGIILSKTDVDDKGGAFISVSYVTGKPILYIGTGQSYEDIKKFEPGIVVEGLGLA